MCELIAGGLINGDRGVLTCVSRVGIGASGSQPLLAFNSLATFLLPLPILSFPVHHNGVARLRPL